MQLCVEVIVKSGRDIDKKVKKGDTYF